jgi:hypothetical protein
MKDLLGDISGPSIGTNSTTSTGLNLNINNNNNNTGNGNDIFQTLNSLEKQLDASSTSTSIPISTSTSTPTSTFTPAVSAPPGTTATLPPPGMRPPGLSQPSAGAMIVDHAASIPMTSTTGSAAAITNTTTTATSLPTSTPGMSTEDAWSEALNQFSALSLTDDFLQADSVRKTQQQNSNTVSNSNSNSNSNNNSNVDTTNQSEEVSNQLVDSLFDDDYDIKKDILLGGEQESSTKKAMMGMFPGLSLQMKMDEPISTNTTTNANTNVTVNVNGTTNSTSDNSSMSATATTTPSKNGPPPHMMGGQPLPPHMMGGPGGHLPHPPPPHMMGGQPLPPHMMGVPGRHPHPPPPHMMGGPGGHPSHPHPPPHMMMPGPGQGLPPHMMGGPGGHPHPPPHMMMGGPPPPGVMPHPAMMMHMQMMQQQHQAQAQAHQQQQQQHQKQQEQEQAKQQNKGNDDDNATTATTATSPQKKENKANSTPTPQKEAKVEKQIFKKMDFPALGADESEIEEERKKEVARMKSQIEEQKKKKKEKMKALAASAKAAKAAGKGDGAKANTGTNAGTSSNEASTNIRITFQDPSPHAPPVPATSIPSTSMTARDLCHVLHSIMRPLLTFENVLDAYNADYYHWSYNDRKSRNLLFSNNIGGNMSNLPNPVWKETKMKAHAMESKFRDTVEKRADEWSKEKQALGRVAKANVKRPRALLATTALSSTAESRVTSGLEIDEEMDEYKQRALLWAARVGIDKGYLAYLNLVELRRLLQSRPGDALSNVDEVENRRGELLHDVENNVSKLHSAFGVEKDESGEVSINRKVLSRTLSLPKGRMLLSRVVDEGILPHPSACHLLPVAIKVILESASTADLTVAPPAGEDRLLRSLTGLVRTVQPSVDVDNLLACLSSVIDAKTVMDEKKKNMKTVLAGKRTLMELLHAIFTRGGEVCVGEHEGEWKAKESSFLMILSGTA